MVLSFFFLFDDEPTTTRSAVRWVNPTTCNSLTGKNDFNLIGYCSCHSSRHTYAQREVQLMHRRNTSFMLNTISISN